MRRLSVRRAAIPLFISSFVVFGVAAGKKAFQPAAENSVASGSSPQPASCRLVLAPLPISKPIDQEIADQQALVLRGASPKGSLERLGWIFVKKARLSFDAGFYKLAEQCAACMETQGASQSDAVLLRAHA